MLRPTRRRPISRRRHIALNLAALSVLAACTTIEAQAPTSPVEPGVHLAVTDVSGQPIAARLILNGEPVAATGDASFVFDIPQAPVARLDVEADGYYTMRHTFSRAELLARQTSDGQVELNDIALVQRKAGRTLFAFGGDAMIGRRYYNPHEGEPVLVREGSELEDSKALLDKVKPYLELADYASINLETPIFEEEPDEVADKFVVFWSAPETLPALEWAGVDYVALGNNHIYDYLGSGLAASFEHLEASALDYSGAGFDETEALIPHRETLAGADFDFHSFVGWPAGTPSQVAEAGKGGATFGTAENLLATTQTSMEANAVPVIQFHGGLEYVEEPTLTIETHLKSAMDEGAALVVAHHPHVLQGFELYKDGLIAWSLGNFLFDQYFPSTHPSALLYVWMDGDTFHHAEAVPIHVKGYKPTPAVGPMRAHVNERLRRLSADRNTILRPSGGHAAIFADQAGGNPDEEWAVSKPVLAASPLAACLSGAERFRTGRDMLARGDLDAHALFGSTDRTWLLDDERISIIADADEPSDMHMQVRLGPGETLGTGMRKFQRVYTRDTPMSVSAQATGSAAASVRVYMQYRRDGQGLWDALREGRKELIGTFDLQAGETVDLRADFNTPRVRVRSLRILLEVESRDDEPIEVELDDLRFVEWLTPFMAREELPGPGGLAGLVLDRSAEECRPTSG